MDTGPSGSAVDIAENRMRTSKEDVDGRWLFVSFEQIVHDYCMSRLTPCLPWPW